MSTESTPSGPPPRVALYQMATGYYFSSALHLVTKLGIADLLKEGPRTPEDLAAATAMHALSLQRVMRLLASVGVFEERENGSFALTPLSECLRTDIVWSVHAMVSMFSGEQQQSAWRELEYCTRTGNPVFRKQGRDNAFKDPGRAPEETERFDAAMADSSALAAAAIAEDYDFSSIHTLVDVGGGTGALLTGLLEERPHLRGIVFDQPAAAERARKRIADRGLADRCEAVGGDFFQEVPAGADAYIIKHVIHDWDDERAVVILKNIHRAMGENGKLLLVEGVYPSRIDQSIESRGAAMNDVAMLVLFGGRHRSEAEFRSLYEAAGFRLTRIVPTRAWASVVEGARA